MDRTTFVRAVEAQLANINRDLAELRNRAARAGSTVMTAVAGLPEQRDRLAQQLANLKDSLAEASEGVRRDLVESCRELRRAIDRLLEETPQDSDDDTGEIRPRPEVRRWQ
jgi:hypothetical protein